MHAEWIERALNNNLHVLVEKSMACSYEEVKYLNELASQRSLVLVENFQFRFHNQLAVISDLINEGKIGEIRCVRCSFGFPPFSDPDNIRNNKELGGGALLDAGAYPLKITQIFLGQDIEVSSANLWYDEEKDIDIWGGAYLKQKKGPLFAEIAFGFDNFYQCNLELWGSEGKINTNRIFTTPPDFSPEIIFESSNGSEIISVEPCNHFEKMLFHFYNLITTKEGLTIEYTQNINQSRLIFEMMRIGCTR
jgi:predicted dehydrogenase